MFLDIIQYVCEGRKEIAKRSKRGEWGRAHLSCIERLVGGVAVVEQTHVDEVD